MSNPEPLRLILCSGSERRKYLLREAGFRFAVIESNFHEAGVSFSNPVVTGKAIARGKVEAVAGKLPTQAVAEGEKTPAPLASELTLLGCDTMVELNGMLYGKPGDPGDARRILRELSGQTHKVYSSVAILRLSAAQPGVKGKTRSQQKVQAFTVVTAVTFKDLSDAEIDEYLATGEAMGKAGAYGIQGHGRKLVRGWKGSVYNVIGFPLEEFLAHEACPLAARVNPSKMPGVQFLDNVAAGL